MSYQVLARKWRPKTFRETVGQEHVLKALINALDHDRLHHAYLFTGTRGVGKTTIARILAKCLNCESGVSSEPCGRCSACSEIAEGRFVDLIEVDAASRTKVEDTRELLDNVQYSPTRGRYKVYLIDEVHMLSGHSFNALLKTLEEPPPHVKFLLATTDPQKLPATILSRCLQFHLKNMPPERIVGHLSRVLEQELVGFEEAGLWLLARAADGSMRDALSLTDQAIAFGAGKVQAADVRTMLGAIDQDTVFGLVEALADADAATLLQRVAQLAEYAADFGTVLDDVLALLHRLAIAQAVPEAAEAGRGDTAQVMALAGRLSAEEVQLYYQLGLIGRREMPLSVDPRAGLEMALLRMLAFRPAGVPEPPQRLLAGGGADPASPSMPSARHSAGASAPAADRPREATVADAPPWSVDPESPPKKPDAAPAPATGAAAERLNSATGPSLRGAQTLSSPGVSAPEHVDADHDTARELGMDERFSGDPGIAAPVADALPEPPPPVAPAPAISDRQRQPEHATRDGAGLHTVGGRSGAALDREAPPAAGDAVTERTSDRPRQLPAWETLDAAAWIAVLPQLEIGGVVGAIATHCWLRSRTADALDLVLDEGHASLFDPRYCGRLGELFSQAWERPVQVAIEVGQPAGDTPAAFRARLRAEQLVAARDALERDPNVQLLRQAFAATLDEASIEPVL